MSDEEREALVRSLEIMRADRDRWKEIAVHLTAPCDDQECYYCPLAHGAAADHLRQTIRTTARQ